MEEEALTTLQEACDSSEQKDECVVRLDDLERAYFRVLQIEGRRSRQMCASGQRGGRHEFQQAGAGRGCTNDAVNSSDRGSVKTPSFCAMTRQCCVLLRNGWDKEEKRR